MKARMRSWTRWTRRRRRRKRREWGRGRRRRG